MMCMRADVMVSSLLGDLKMNQTFPMSRQGVRSGKPPPYMTTSSLGSYISKADAERSSLFFSGWVSSSSSYVAVLLMYSHRSR